MGIQPIDLQTMYSQLSNVSKNYSVQQQAQLTEAMQQQNNIQHNLENSQKVQQTSNNRGNTNSVNEDGRSGSGTYNQQKRNKQQNENESENESFNTGNLKSYTPYIGTIIDITR